MTPEGRVKAKLKKLLKEYEPDIYTFWPVQSGFGTYGLDVHGSYLGRAFAIELKAGRKAMTERQQITADVMRSAGVTVFLINEVEDTWEEFEAWLSLVDWSD